MSHAERNDVVFMERVRFKRASVHDIENCEEKALEQSKETACEHQTERRASVELNCRSVAADG